MPRRKPQQSRTPTRRRLARGEAPGAAPAARALADDAAASATALPPDEPGAAARDEARAAARQRAPRRDGDRTAPSALPPPREVPAEPRAARALPPPGPLRLQERRSAETRTRILDATVDCLYERGYAGTTTAEIAARAGISKGAELHHFPTKQSLVIGALEYLFALRLAASRDPEVIRRLPTDKRQRLAAIIQMLVPVYGGKIFYAWLELAVASRTDVALREAVSRASVRFSERVLEVWKDLFGAAGDDLWRARALDQIVNGQFAALAVGQILAGPDGNRGAVAETVALLNEIGDFLLSRKSKGSES